jgi:hypothetical protein
MTNVGGFGTAAAPHPLTVVRTVMSKKRHVVVTVNDTMQRKYRYVRSAPVGRSFDPQFRPDLTPKEMLALGIFCGKYMTDCRKEFPASWFARARLSPSGRDCALNYFGVDASQPLSAWRRKDGFTRTIRAAGSSGTADTIWAAACRRRTPGRSNAGRPSEGTSRKLNGIARRAIRRAGRDSGKRCCTGLMTAARFERRARLDYSAGQRW